MARSETETHGLGKWEDLDTPGAQGPTGLNFNWDTIDAAMPFYGTSFPPTYPLNKIFMRSDLNLLYQNTGTKLVPVWTPLSASGSAPVFLGSLSAPDLILSGDLQLGVDECVVNCRRLILNGFKLTQHALAWHLTIYAGEYIDFGMGGSIEPNTPTVNGGAFQAKPTPGIGPSGGFPHGGTAGASAVGTWIFTPKMIGTGTIYGGGGNGGDGEDGSTALAAPATGNGGAGGGYVADLVIHGATLTPLAVATRGQIGTIAGAGSGPVASGVKGHLGTGLTGPQRNWLRDLQRLINPGMDKLLDTAFSNSLKAFLGSAGNVGQGGGGMYGNFGGGAFALTGSSGPGGGPGIFDADGGKGGDSPVIVAGFNSAAHGVFGGGSGGSGAGGGLCVVVCLSIAPTITILCTGGNGGKAGNADNSLQPLDHAAGAGGGGGGGGGLLILATPQLLSAIDASVAGGQGGAGGLGAGAGEAAGSPGDDGVDGTLYYCKL